jgi:hypothetical protein
MLSRPYARSWRSTEPEALEDGEGFAAFEVPNASRVWSGVLLEEELISPVRAAQMLGLPLNIVGRAIRGRDL